MKKDRWQAAHGVIGPVPQVVFNAINGRVAATDNRRWKGDGNKRLVRLQRCSMPDKYQALILARVFGR